MDVYFVSSQKARPGLFGTPIILPCVEDTTNQDLYQFVWTQVSRLVSPLPPSEAKSANHAQDWWGNTVEGYHGGSIFMGTLSHVYRTSLKYAVYIMYWFTETIFLKWHSNETEILAIHGDWLPQS